MTSQGDLFTYEQPAPKAYPERAGSKTGGTSKAAADRIESKAETLRGQVLRMLKTGRPMTADEIADALHESVLSIRPRVSELAKKDLVWRTGERRLNRSGMSAHVWTAQPLRQS